jgi:hypothetical protein
MKILLDMNLSPTWVGFLKAGRIRNYPLGLAGIANS